jgi:hypothetical protein
MVDQVVTSEEDTFDAECYSDSLLADKETTIKKVCGTIAEGNGIHVQELTKCLDEAEFCRECCNSHHGSVMEVQRK